MPRLRMEDIKLEKQVPIPPRQAKSTDCMTILDQMELHDSFALPKQQRTTLNNLLIRYKKHNGKRQFMTRTVDGGDAVRCWRIK